MTALLLPLHPRDEAHLLWAMLNFPLDKKRSTVHLRLWTGHLGTAGTPDRHLHFALSATDYPRLSSLRVLRPDVLHQGHFRLGERMISLTDYQATLDPSGIMSVTPVMVEVQKMLLGSYQMRGLRSTLRAFAQEVWNTPEVWKQHVDAEGYLHVAFRRPKALPPLLARQITDWHNLTRGHRYHLVYETNETADKSNNVMEVLDGNGHLIKRYTEAVAIRKAGGPLAELISRHPKERERGIPYRTALVFLAQ